MACVSSNLHRVHDTGHEAVSPGRRDPGSIWAVAAFLLFMSLSDSALAQHLGQGPDDGISIWRVVATLLACVAVAVAAALALKHRMGGSTAQLFVKRKNPRLEMIETIRLRPQIDLCIVACDGEELLLVSSPQGASLLHPMSRRSEADAKP
jgi:hypothetical protein